MNDYKRILLQRNEEDIYKDVTSTDIPDILDALVSKNIISSEENAAISRSSNKKTEKLIKIMLAKKDGPWFEELLNALQTNHDWIANKIRAQYDSKLEERRSFYLKHIPPLPQHNVSRNPLVQNVREGITRLKGHRYLVVHGMSGSGKTCLVVDALQDVHFLEKYLEGKVYWLSVGDFNELDDLQRYELQKKLSDQIGRDIKPQHDLLIQLKDYFSYNTASLLVLDKVSSCDVVSALDVGCKILVTTQDYDVVKDKTKTLFPVDNGFLESESVKLLEDFVFDRQGKLSSSLNDVAIKIHQTWKGHPMIIGLIGGELSSDNEKRKESQMSKVPWIVYERSSVSVESNPRRRSVVEEQISSVIELTTKKLKPHQRSLYDMLAVFVEDTNITTDVLQILWGQEFHEVERSIDSFYRRSLVFKKFNDHLQKAVYGIHDIVMNHLKNNKTEVELQNMHNDLVSKYFTACKGNFANLPQDNYIYSYLCHHVENAKRWNDLRDQFFSLHFIESKLKATGPGDLLLDLHKYATGLAGSNEEYSTKVEAIKKFVKDSGWDINRNEVDVIQSALLQPNESYLYQEGAKIASNSNATKIYFSPIYKSLDQPKDLEMLLSNVNTVCIISSSPKCQGNNRVLIYPDDDGLIVEMDLNYRQRRRSFKEESPVVLIKLSSPCNKFLSALNNGKVNVWNLPTEAATNVDTPPPRLRQANYISHFPETRVLPSCSFDLGGPMTCASFSSDGKLIVCGSRQGIVKMFNLEENKMQLHIDLNPLPYAIACAFVCEDRFIVYGCTDNNIYFHFIYFHFGVPSDPYGLEMGNRYGGLVDLLCMTDEVRHLIVVHKKAVLLLQWEDETLVERKEGIKYELVNPIEDRIFYQENIQIFSAVYQQSHRLLLGTTNGCFLLFDILNRNCPPFKCGSGEVKAIDMVGSSIVYVQHDMVKMCWPESDHKHISQPRSMHLGWTSRNVSVFATATDKIQVYHDGKLCADKIQPRTCVVRVSSCDDHVLFATSEGTVFLYDTTTRDCHSLPFNFNSEVYYLNVAIYQSSPVYIAAAKDGESFILQVIVPRTMEKRDCENITAEVVKTFLCSQQQCLIVVLKDCSILVWNMKDFSPLHVGRNAQITDASLSANADILVLTDMENCFHLFSLQWLQVETGITKVSHLNDRSKFRPDSNNYKLDSIKNGIDEVDGIAPSRMSESYFTVKSSVKPLPSPAWCCCVCPEAKLVAIGYGDNKVMVWDLIRKTPCISFEVLPRRKTKVGKVKFSPYCTQFGSRRYQLVLFVVTDCISLWDLSDLVDDKKILDATPECLGCVSTGGSAIQELSISPDFTKFSAFDVTGKLLLWKVWERQNENATTLDSRVKNMSLTLKKY